MSDEKLGADVQAYIRGELTGPEAQTLFDILEGMGHRNLRDTLEKLGLTT
jgi:hypothetical protein